MTLSEDHGSQAHHGTLQKQLHLRSLALPRGLTMEPPEMTAIAEAE